MLAELVRPLEAEVTALKEKLAQGAKRSKFEVSLAQIPPELEQQLEFRLRKDLGPQVLKEAREQSEQVLEGAKAAIAQKTTQTHDEFRQRVTKELQAVEQRTQGLSTDAAQNLREHLNRGLGELHQEVVGAGNRLKQLSQELLRVMQQTLGEEHDAKRRHLEQVQAVVKSESARLQTEIADLDRRMAKLDESARQLEAGLDKRLSQMASDTVRTARGQMEGALELAMNELSTRTAQELANQLEETSSSLKIIQQDTRSFGFGLAAASFRRSTAIVRAEHGRTGAAIRGALACGLRWRPELPGENSGRAIRVAGYKRRCRGSTRIE